MTIYVGKLLRLSLEKLDRVRLVTLDLLDQIITNGHLVVDDTNLIKAMEKKRHLEKSESIESRKKTRRERIQNWINLATAEEIPRLVDEQ
jgi:hypothetical protein